MSEGGWVKRRISGRQRGKQAWKLWGGVDRAHVAGMGEKLDSGWWDISEIRISQGLLVSIFQKIQLCYVGESQSFKCSQTHLFCDFLCQLNCHTLTKPLLTVTRLKSLIIWFQNSRLTLHRPRQMVNYISILGAICFLFFWVFLATLRLVGS